MKPPSGMQALASRIAMAALLLSLAGLAHAAEPVGTVLTVKGVVTAERAGGEAVFLDTESAVHEGDTIISAEKSFAVISFIDDSRVVVRQESELLIEGYRFDEDERSSVLNLLKGGIRAVTGTIARENPDNYKLETPVASLGVRGTSYDARLCDEACRAEELQQSSWQAAPAESGCEIRLNIDEFPTGAYFSVREGVVVVSKAGESITVRPGDIGFADADRVGCLPQLPAFMFDDQTPLPETTDFREFTPLMCTP